MPDTGVRLSSSVSQSASGWVNWNSGSTSTPIAPTSVEQRLDAKHLQFDSGSQVTTPYIYFTGLGITSLQIPEGSTIDGVEVIVNVSSNYSGNGLVFEDQPATNRSPISIPEDPMGGL